MKSLKLAVLPLMEEQLSRKAIKDLQTSSQSANQNLNSINLPSGYNP
jgi:hypothetical protein